MVYSVATYLNMLKLAKRSPKTIKSYERKLGYFAQFLGVPLAELHNHLTPENLINYAATLTHQSEGATAIQLGIIARFYTVNGVKFDEMQYRVIRGRNTTGQDDKPLSLPILQRMIDLGDVHAKAIILFMISTGIRPGELSQLLASDVTGDTAKIRNEIAKGGRGGTVYLTSECREYLDAWLKDRPRYLAIAAQRTWYKGDPAKDNRLFISSYNTLKDIWARLYDAADGEVGKYNRRKCTMHSTRKYFRTHAVKTMDLDVVEKILRHEGYLTRSYVRISDDECRVAFHAGEEVLYITRPRQREVENIEAIKKENRKLKDLEKDVKFFKRYIERQEQKKREK